MITTAYEGYLNREAKRFSDNTEDQKYFIAQSLRVDCADGNPQAFDIVGRIGDKAFDLSTFAKSAELIYK